MARLDDVKAGRICPVVAFADRVDSTGRHERRGLGEWRDVRAVSGWPFEGEHSLKLEPGERRELGVEVVADATTPPLFPPPADRERYVPRVTSSDGALAPLLGRARSCTKCGQPVRTSVAVSFCHRSTTARLTPRRFGSSCCTRHGRPEQSTRKLKGLSRLSRLPWGGLRRKRRRLDLCDTSTRAAAGSQTRDGRIPPMGCAMPMARLLTARFLCARCRAIATKPCSRGQRFSMPSPAKTPGHVRRGLHSWRSGSVLRSGLTRRQVRTLQWHSTGREGRSPR